MGGNVSKDMSSSDVTNEFITNVVTNVTNDKTTTVSTEQKQKIGCSEDVLNNVAAACAKATDLQTNAKTDLYKAYIAAGTEPSDALIASFDKKPPVCDACSAKKILQSSVMTINMQDITDNSIASKIQTDLLSKLDATKKTLQNEGFSKNDVLDSSISTIKNKIESDITTNIINKTLTSFVTNQNQEIGNTMGVEDVSQVSVVNFVSAALVENVVEGDESVKAAIENITTKENIQKSIASNTTDMVGSVANNLIGTVGDVANNAVDTVGNMTSTLIIGIVVGIIAFVFIVFKMMSGGGNPQSMQQQYGQPMQQYVSSPMQQQLGSLGSQLGSQFNNAASRLGSLGSMATNALGSQLGSLATNARGVQNAASAFKQFGNMASQARHLTSL